VTGTVQDGAKPLRLSVIGATGAAGSALLAAVDRRRSDAADAVHIVALTSDTRIDRLHDLISRFAPAVAVSADETAMRHLRDLALGSHTHTGAGRQALLDAVRMPADLVLVAAPGPAGLELAHAALAPGRRVLVSSMHVFAASGRFLFDQAATLGATVAPFDPLFSPLMAWWPGVRREDVRRLIVADTALHHGWKASDAAQNQSELATCVPLLAAQALLEWPNDQTSIAPLPDGVAAACDSQARESLAPNTDTIDGIADDVLAGRSVRVTADQAYPLLRSETAEKQPRTLEPWEEIVRRASQLGMTAPAMLLGGIDVAAAAVQEQRLPPAAVTKLLTQLLNILEGRHTFAGRPGVQDFVSADFDGRGMAYELLASQDWRNV
jgi:1-deoxy-D-xylulose-5-phosphate reductoisomerase